MIRTDIDKTCERAVFSALFVFFLFFGMRFAHAADVPAPSTCKIDDQVQALAKAQETNAGSNEIEAIKAELVARQNLLRILMHCALNDVARVRADLQSIPLSEDSDQQIKTRIAGQLSDLLRESSLQDARINDFGIRDTQDTARSLKDWRTRIYGPMKERAQSFALWIQSRKLIVAAEERLIGIQATLRSLDISDNEIIRNNIGKAQVNLKNARDAHEKVQILFMQTGSSDELSNVIKSSLDALMESYKNFFGISDEVKKVVPL